jgi:hypothetical protein
MASFAVGPEPVSDTLGHTSPIHHIKNIDDHLLWTGGAAWAI